MPADRIDRTVITDPFPGLTAEEAAQRLQADGPNEMPGAGRRSMLRMLAGVLLEPMFLLLLVAAGLYLVLGDLTEAVFLLLAVVAVIVQSLYQEQRTERALEALRDLAAPRALVVRDGQRIRIASREVVVGDCLVMGEGDRIPADAILLRGTLSANESLLTGEPAPVRKLPGTADSTLGTPGDEGGCSLFASALVTGGQGLARVCATGPRTAAGAIGQSLSQARPPVSSLQRESRRVVRWMASAGIGASVALAVLAWWWNDRSPVEAVLMGLALAMALLPAEVPLVLAVFLAMAPGAAPGVGAPGAGGRVLGRHLGAGGRQDRHAHVEPDGGCGAAGRAAAVAGGRRGRTGRRGPRDRRLRAHGHADRPVRPDGDGDTGFRRPLGACRRLRGRAGLVRTRLPDHARDPGDDARLCAG
jgi:magnesium-transporting ATPase (P-type)